MASLGSIKASAQRIRNGSSNPEVQQLAQLIYDLSRECEDIEKQAKDAEHEARRAARH